MRLFRPARSRNPDRRAALAGVCLLLVGIAAASAEAQVIDRPIDADPVRIDAGAVRGNRLASGVKTYLGIPFAAPPTGDRRWRAPQPVTPWRGVYNADRKGPECIQPLRPHNINHYFGEEATSEDCLTLNLWAPAEAAPGAKLPVIVYFYGGGSTIGSSGMALYGGEPMAARGAIFVNFNYRLGALGFMAHPELTAESPDHASGNYGYLDQIAALQWIQRNIAAFGGDPDHVVISGQSAGAGSVSLMQISPLARGLFSGVVAMSGSQWGNGGASIRPLSEAESTGVQAQTALRAASLDDMRQVPADRILALQEDCQLGCTNGNIRFGGATVDGHFLPDQPAALFAAHRNSDVPVITGFTRDESDNALKATRTVAEFRAAAQVAYGADAERFLGLYDPKTDAEVHVLGSAAARDAAVGRGARNWAIAQGRANRSPTYIFMLSRVQPFNPAVVIADHPERIGAYHTSDVPYWFGTLEALNLFRPTRIWTGEDRRLSGRMMDALIAFARTGDPSTPDMAWPGWSARDERYLDLDVTPGVLRFDPARMEFVNAHPITPAAAAPARGTRD
jgi:para-nitrobenzyl esterase